MGGGAPIQVYDRDVGRAVRLGRLGFAVTGDLQAEIDAAVVDAGTLGDIPSLPGDIRRVAPGARIVAIVTAEGVDAASRFLGLENLGFAREADDAELAFELTIATPARLSLAEEQNGYALRLAALGEEIARIARAIEPPTPPADAPPVPDSPLAFDPATLRGVLKARRQRDALFPPGTFADPVWDMLLDLTAARGEGKAVSVSSLAIAAAVPTTTALRT